MPQLFSLPPGQRQIATFPRFGLSQYANRYRENFGDIAINISGGSIEPQVLDNQVLQTLPRKQQGSDFHCVTTWSCRQLQWSGYRFSDVYQALIKPHLSPSSNISEVVFRASDGFGSSLPLEDLLVDDVLLADQLNGQSLCAKHGAPIRLVAPAHYGYKNLKHLKAIELYTPNQNFDLPGFRFMDHPRARVALEERGRGIPGLLLRYLYRPLIAPTIRRFQKAMD